jgi:hypothetical protein
MRLAIRFAATKIFDHADASVSIPTFVWFFTSHHDDHHFADRRRPRSSTSTTTTTSTTTSLDGAAPSSSPGTSPRGDTCGRYTAPLIAQR